MFYIFLFLFSSFLFFLAEKFAFSKVLFYVLSFFSIFLLSFFAGVRDLSIGTDTNGYGVFVFNECLYSNNVLEDAFSDGWIEPFFFLIFWVATLFSKDIHLALFFIMFLELTFVFLGYKYFVNPFTYDLKRVTNENSIIGQVPLWLAMLLFNLFFFNWSMNAMRQGLAVAWCVFSYQFLDKRNNYKLILCAIVSFFFHKTSVILFIFYFFLLWFKKRSVKKQKKYIVVFLILSVLSVFLFLKILEYVTEQIPLMSIYLSYGGNGSFESGISSIDLFLVTILTFIMIILRYFRVSKRQDFHIAILLLIATYSGLLLGSFTYFATRIAFYFFILLIPFVLGIANSKHLNIIGRIISCSIILLLYIFQFYWMRIHYGGGDTYPYKSEILNVVAY